MTFVHDFTYVDLPVTIVRERMLEAMVDWLEEAATEGFAHGERVLADIGPSRAVAPVSKHVCVSFAPPYERGDVLVFPIQWRATGARPLFPVMDADLEIAPMGGDRTEISLMGRYSPPLGDVGRSLDRMLLHRLGEATVRSLLARLGELVVQHQVPLASA